MSNKPSLRLNVPERPDQVRFISKLSATTRDDLQHYTVLLNAGRRNKLSRDEVLDHLLADFFAKDSGFQRAKREQEQAPVQNGTNESENGTEHRAAA